MNRLNKFRSVFQNATRRIYAFKSDRRGVAALEFAIIAPILILLFLGTIEISLAVAVDRKVSRVSSAVADLITQERDPLTSETLDSIFDIADRIMFPHGDTVRISVVGIKIDASRKATVAWSRTFRETLKPTVGSPYPVPNEIKIPDTFLVAAIAKTDHAPAFSFVNYANGSLSLDAASIELVEEIYLRPRHTPTLECSGC